MFHAVKPFTSLILCLGGRFGSILCRTSCFASVGLEEMVEFILFFQIDRGKIACAARKWTKSAPQNRRNNLCLCFSLHPSSMPEKYCNGNFHWVLGLCPTYSLFSFVYSQGFWIHYLYSINSVICRPSGHTVGRPPGPNLEPGMGSPEAGTLANI